VPGHAGFVACWKELPVYPSDLSGLNPSAPRARHITALCMLLAAGMSSAAQPALQHHRADAAAPASARPGVATGLRVTGAWARATSAGVPGAVYFTIKNCGSTEATLLGARSNAAASATFHRTVQEAGISRMRPAGEIRIAPGQTVRIEPIGMHLMLNGLKQPLAVGLPLTLTLNFREADAVEVRVKVIAATAAAPDDTGHDMVGHAHAAGAR
jgi:periplasmic copper chaperone A